MTRPDCARCGHPASYHINFVNEGKPKPPGPPDYPRPKNFCCHPTTRSFCACPDYVGEPAAPASSATTSPTVARELMTVTESNDPKNWNRTKEPCLGCGSSAWTWRALEGKIMRPKTCSSCDD